MHVKSTSYKLVRRRYLSLLPVSPVNQPDRHRLPHCARAGTEPPTGRDRLTDRRGIKHRSSFFFIARRRTYPSAPQNSIIPPPPTTPKPQPPENADDGDDGDRSKSPPCRAHHPKHEARQITGALERDACGPPAQEHHRPARPTRLRSGTPANEH